MMARPVDTGRDQAGRFTRSGNPNGRPRGSVNRTTAAIETLLVGESESLTRKAIELALAGDVTALRLCLDRIAPPRRGRLIRIKLPRVTSPAGLVDAVAALVAEVSSGRITAEEGVAIGELLNLQGRVLELNDIDDRVRQLEARHGA